MGSILGSVGRLVLGCCLSLFESWDWRDRREMVPGLVCVDPEWMLNGYVGLHLDWAAGCLLGVAARRGLEVHVRMPLQLFHWESGCCCGVACAAVFCRLERQVAAMGQLEHVVLDMCLAACIGARAGCPYRASSVSCDWASSGLVA